MRERPDGYTAPMSRGFRITHVLASALTVLTLGACASAPEPRMRLGSMPFTGLWTLYTQADVKDLGVHRYEPWWDRLNGRDEVSRGTMYSCGVGFLDLSHIREYMDWTRFVHDRVLERLAPHESKSPSQDLGEAEFSWSDADFSLRVKAPAWLDALPPAERAAAVREASIRIAQRTTVIMGTWHEIATWYGQTTVMGISEKRSAFTWDDTTSHALAALAAGRALRLSEHNWNLAASRGLAEELAAVGVMRSECETAAVKGSQGVWWSDGEPIRRDLDTGLATGFKTPWLVPRLECCPDAKPMVLSVELPPERWGVDAGDWSGAVTLTIQAPPWLLRRVLGRSDLPRGTIINPEADFPAIMERLRTHVRAEHGPLGDKPDFPEPATPR